MGGIRQEDFFGSGRDLDAEAAIRRAEELICAAFGLVEEVPFVPDETQGRLIEGVGSGVLGASEMAEELLGPEWLH